MTHFPTGSWLWYDRVTMVLPVHRRLRRPATAGGGAIDPRYGVHFVNFRESRLGGSEALA